MGDQFNDFYSEVFEELSSFGFIEDMHVCDNLGDHLVGNLYVKFEDETDAAKALNSLNGRYYAGRPLQVEFSPVTDFREARCRQFDESMCGRGGYCNFMHIKPPSRSLKRDLLKDQKRPSSSSSGSSSGSSSSSSRSRSRSRSRDRRKRKDKK